MSKPRCVTCGNAYPCACLDARYGDVAFGYSRPLAHRTDPGVPGYWINETSGALRPVVEKYIHHVKLDAQEIATMRAYIRQWIAGDFRGPAVDRLRTAVDSIVDQDSLDVWLSDALAAGIDPL